MRSIEIIKIVLLQNV